MQLILFMDGMPGDSFPAIAFNPEGSGPDIHKRTCKGAVAVHCQTIVNSNGVPVIRNHFVTIHTIFLFFFFLKKDA